MDPRPIGIFDSGIGGLSVVQEIQRLAPAETILYFADTAYFPYGPRPAAEVRKRAFAISARLVQSGVKMIVAACNTASAAALEDLRGAFDIPFVGMVPGVKPAAAASLSRRIVILATPGTLGGELYARVVAEFGKAARVVSVPGAGLAERVECGKASSPETARLLREILEPEVARGADTVVLGCTHYHFLRDALGRLFPGVQVVDTSEAVARRAIQLLDERQAQAPVGACGALHLIVSGDRQRFRETMAQTGFAPAAGEATPC